MNLEEKIKAEMHDLLCHDDVRKAVGVLGNDLLELLILGFKLRILLNERESGPVAEMAAYACLQLLREERAAQVSKDEKVVVA